MRTSTLVEISHAWADVVDAVAPSVVQVAGRRRPASGVVFDADLILTTMRAIGGEDGLSHARRSHTRRDARGLGPSRPIDVCSSIARAGVGLRQSSRILNPEDAPDAANAKLVSILESDGTAYAGLSHECSVLAAEILDRHGPVADHEPGMTPGDLGRVDPDITGGIATDDLVSLVQEFRARPRDQQAEGARELARGRRNLRIVVHVRGKGIAVGVDRPNHAARACRVPHGLTNLVDHPSEAGVRDEHARPHALQQIGLRHGGWAVLYEHPERLERFRGEVHGLGTAEEAASVEIDGAAGKSQSHDRIQLAIGNGASATCGKSGNAKKTVRTPRRASCIFPPGRVDKRRALPGEAGGVE